MDLENTTNTTEQVTTNQENTTPNETKPQVDLGSYFEKLSEDLGKQMERFFTSNSSKQADEFGLTQEQMKEAAKDYLAKSKSKEQTLADENINLKNQIKSMKSTNTLNEIFNKLEVNTDLKDDLLKMVNVNDFYDEKDELKVDELEKSFSSVITRIPGFKKETPNVNFGNTKPEQQTDHQKMKSLEEMAREMMGLNKKNNK